MLPRPCALAGLNAGGVPLATLAQKARSWSLPWVRGRVVRRRQVGSTPPRHVVDQRCRKGTPVLNPAGKASTTSSTRVASTWTIKRNWWLQSIDWSEGTAIRGAHCLHLDKRSLRVC